MAWNPESASQEPDKRSQGEEAARPQPDADRRSSSNAADVGVGGSKGGSEWHEARREIVSAGVKLAFVAPLITSFLARDAHAAGSNHSCYPVGTECGGGTAEPCCPGSLCLPDVGSSTGSRCQ